MTNYFLKGHDQGHVTHFYFLGVKWYLWNDWSPSHQILHTDYIKYRTIIIHTILTIITPLKEGVRIIHVN